MWNDQSARLRASIAATNKANAYANRLQRELVAIFRPLVGKQVIKNDGSLLERVKKLLPEFPCQPGLHVYRTSSAYWVGFAVKASVNEEPGPGCQYYEATVRVGDIESGTQTLKQVYDDPADRRTDYTFEEVVEKRRLCEEARKVYEAAKGECYPFGEG
jgi:hypothetical protein